MDKATERAYIKLKTAEYLLKGNKITQCKMGQRSEQPNLPNESYE